MRDLFAILAIALAVISLGVFRVPDENALVAAGIKAEAEAALYQARHPLDIAVKARTVTVSGRVESEAEAEQVVAQLTDLQGVEAVENLLTILPTVAPFDLGMTKAAGLVTVAGVVPQEGLARQLTELFALDEPDLTVAAGAPDGLWGEVALRAAQTLAGMEEGQVRLVDRDLAISGVVHLPAQLRQIEAGFAEVPEGYSATLTITALDDGLPYSLLVTRDPFMGLRAFGKLPPDYAGPVAAVIDGAEGAITHAPKPLDAPGFEEALAAIAPLVEALELGTISVTPGVVTVQGGPMPPAIIAQIDALELPLGYALNRSLVPVDDGPALTLTVTWDGSALDFHGRVPADFDAGAWAAGFGAPLGAEQLDRSPYPDLQGWDDPLQPGLRALSALRSGVLELDATGLRLTGLAADPAARQMARAALGDSGEADLQLADDGAPAVFELTYDAATGASLQGKLPAGLTPAAMAEALGLDAVRGDPRVAPGGDAAPVLDALRAVQPYLDLLDGMTLDHGPGAPLSLRLQVTPGAPVALLRQQLALPNGVQATIDSASPPLPGTQRTHVVLGLPQVFTDGYWLPKLSISPTAEACTKAMAEAKPVPFEENGFALALGAVHPLAQLAAVARDCTWTGDLTLMIEVQAGKTDYPALNRQLARRRAEALRAALAERGVPRARIEAIGQAADDAGETVRYLWQ
ncbi:BON domain-containing protein [Tropicibacter oceani]|uniref:BON domain-containing protein n=1 Tax=Tropicibacter oceani TaxID=3058420 RepID=A0ABY8QKH8_9RHOB|nr:BON domain-containing protein [Tropicibacter oceani]WGW05034.1 BON domain-containing protein [Tropicibacter oceani]